MVVGLGNKLKAMSMRSWRLTCFVCLEILVLQQGCSSKGQIWAKLATEPPMDFLISKLIPRCCLSWHGSNKAGSLPFKWRCPDSVADVFHVCCANGCSWFASYLGALHFCNSDCLHVSIRGTSFSLLFSKLSKLLL